MNTEPPNGIRLQKFLAAAGAGSRRHCEELITTGRVRVDPLFPASDAINASAAYVTFEPGARSNWHTHPCGQQLIVVSGVGLTGVWDGPVVEIRAGDVITCPVGVKHWHGASPMTAMTHIAVTGYQGESAVNWMEPVTDEQYNRK